MLSNCDEPELNDFEDARDIINYVDEHKDDVISLEQTKEINDYNVKITNIIDNRVIEIVTFEMYKKNKNKYIKLYKMRTLTQFLT